MTYAPPSVLPVAPPAEPSLLATLAHDEVLVLALLVAFAVLATAHVALVWGLLRRPPRWRAPVALLLAPLAPYWGAREGMHTRVVVWVASAIAYAVLRVLARL